MTLTSTLSLTKSLLSKAFIVVFIAWFLSLLTVYVPTSNMLTPTFPKTINNIALTIFIALTGVATPMSLYLGVDKLRAKP